MRSSLRLKRALRLRRRDGGGGGERWRLGAGGDGGTATGTEFCFPSACTGKTVRVGDCNAVEVGDCVGFRVGVGVLVLEAVPRHMPSRIKIKPLIENV